MSSFTTLYLASDKRANIGTSTRPSGFLGAWDFTNSDHNGTDARLLDTNSYSSQLSVAPTWSSITMIIKSMGHCQYLSMALDAQTIAMGGNWTIAFAADCTNDSGPMQGWTGRAALYLVNGSTGAIRQTIIALADLGSSSRQQVTTEKTCYNASISNPAPITVTAGDYLCLEVGVKADAGMSSLTPTTHTYDEGATTISSDNASTSDAKSVLGAPSSISYSAFADTWVPQPPPSPFLLNKSAETMRQSQYMGSAGFTPWPPPTPAVVLPWGYENTPDQQRPCPDLTKIKVY